MGLQRIVLGFALLAFTNTAWATQAGFYRATDSHLTEKFGSIFYLFPQEKLKGKAVLHGINTFYKNIRVIGRSVDLEVETGFFDKSNLEFLGSSLSEVSNYLRAPASSVLSLRSKTKMIAHRGSTFMNQTNPDSYYAANTVEGFETALRSGFQGIELDIHQTKDGVIAISHDNDLSVSTTCQGKVTESTYERIKSCQVVRSSLIPEISLVSEPAKIASALPILSEVFDRFLADARLQILIVDTKPGDFNSLASAILELMEPLTIAEREKLVFLVHDKKLIDAIHSVYPFQTVALEGKTGWELLSYKEREDYFYGNAISFNVGLGMGLFSGKSGLPAAIDIIGGALTAFLITLQKNHADIGSLPWSKDNFARYQSTVEMANQRSVKNIAWTINTAEKIKTLHELASSPDLMLTDLSFSQIAKMQLEWIFQSL